MPKIDENSPLTETLSDYNTHKMFQNLMNL